MRAVLTAISCGIVYGASMSSACADSVLESEYRLACVKSYKHGYAEEAVQPCLVAADHGDVESQLILGSLYRLGAVAAATGNKGYVSDDASAMEWYRRAANQGNPRGQFNVGQMYAEGAGVPQDYLEAAKWYLLAADQGETGAQDYLAVLYEYGRGVSQDLIQAYKWYALSDLDPRPHSPLSARNRDSVAQSLTPSQLAEARKLVQDWKPH
jgi:hypothetical protein